MAMFNKKKRMQWTALLIAVVRLNTCNGEILKGEIKCWDKENAVICNTAEDCSWNPDAFPTKTGEHECQTDSENIQCIQLSQRTCSSYKSCCFSYTPLHIDLCTICWESKIKCWDKTNKTICNTPNKCSWNTDVFPKKSGNYKCETVLISNVSEMHCSNTSSKTEKCDSNKDCGFTYSFPPNVICLMSLLPEITCKHNKIPKCETPKDCRWNPDEFPSKSGTHECKFALGDLSCTPKSAPISGAKCSSYKKCGFHNELARIAKCKISWGPGTPEKYVSTIPPVAWSVPLVVGLAGLFFWLYWRNRTPQLQQQGALHPANIVPLLPHPPPPN